VPLATCSLPPVAKATPDPRVLWIQYCLAKQGYNQNDVVAESGASKSLVSRVFSGDRLTGEKATEVMKVTARLARMTASGLFSGEMP
jgi:hypothetical protein